MKVDIVQYDIVWEHPQANRSKISKFLAETDEDFDLLVLPEMFNTGFTMDTTNNYELMDGETISWLVEQAMLCQCVVTGSIIVKSNEHFYNRLFWITPDGSVNTYDKKHLFTLAKEDQHFTPGKQRQVFELDVEDVTWRICPLICYDLRFPVWSRNNEDYDLLLYVANFPEKRRYAWSQLLIARAIENQSYTIGVNRIGQDGIGIPYSGDSVVLDYAGLPIVEAHSAEGIFFVTLSKAKQTTYRRAYNFLRDRDQFEII
jgi:predicted amidohydrolase